VVLKVTDAYSVLQDNYEAMKKERLAFNRAIERKLAEEDPDLELYSWSHTSTSKPRGEEP
jgi:hypothetical protein